MRASRCDLAKAALTQAERQASAAHALVDGTQVQNNPAVLEAKSAFRDAWIAAQRNAVVAPVTGYVAERSVQLGQHIQAGQALMTVIPLHALWVDANFKEVQLRNLRIGQPAEVRSDLYGGAFIYPRACHGHVGGNRRRIRAAAAAECVGQLDQGGAARAGEDRDRRRGTREVAAARRSVGDRDRRHDQDGWGGSGAPRPPIRPVGETDVYSQDLARANAEADAIVSRNLGAAN